MSCSVNRAKKWRGKALKTQATSVVGMVVGAHQTMHCIAVENGVRLGAARIFVPSKTTKS